MVPPASIRERTPVVEQAGFLVLGSGPAGQKAAIQAAKAGQSAVLVERERAVGGACVRTGTIPSKTLRERAARPRRHGEPDPLERPLSELLAGVGDVVAAHDHYMSAQLARNGVRVLRGDARFIDGRTIEVTRIAAPPLRLAAPRIVIATGSRPRAPAQLAIDHEHVLDSDSILSLAWLPRSLLVLGGGVIASEYASIFAALGCRVQQADRNDRPLAFVDRELTDLYERALRDAGSEFLPRSVARSLGWDGISQVVAEFEDGRRVLADKALVALGRVANVESLQLEAAGVQLNRAGHVAVDDELRTTAPGIYAAGDVIGPPALASAAMEQGRRAACHALGLLAPAEFAEQLPAGIYSIPEISTVGLDEVATIARFGGALVGRARFDEIARGQISGRPRGLLKLVATPDGREVVGVQVAGDGATELVHVGQVGLMARLGVDAYVDTVFNFPTMAEAYRVAALDIVRQRRRVTESGSVTASAAAQ
ncbi:MAG: Si-specific NAD(P)(+) transhydrogenase [Steroidobacteraceae bacterium]